MTTPVKEKDVRQPRTALIEHTGAAKRNLIEHLESGQRDHAELRRLMEVFISYQTAADVLGGYCRVEPVGGTDA